MYSLCIFARTVYLPSLCLLLKLVPAKDWKRSISKNLTYQPNWNFNSAVDLVFKLAFIWNQTWLFSDNFENWPFSGQWLMTLASGNLQLLVKSVLIDRFQKNKKFYTRPNQENQTRWQNKCFCLMATKMIMF